MIKYITVVSAIFIIILAYHTHSMAYTGCNIDTTDWVWEDKTGDEFLVPCDQYNSDDPENVWNHRVACYTVDFTNGCTAVVCCGATNGTVYCQNEELVCTNDNPPQVPHLSTVTLTKKCYMQGGTPEADICVIVCPNGLSAPAYECDAIIEDALEKWGDTNPGNTWDEDRQEQCNCP